MSDEVCPVCGGTGPEPKREPAEPMPEGWKEKLLAAHADAKQAERQPVTDAKLRRWEKILSHNACTHGMVDTVAREMREILEGRAALQGGKE